jgi:hypothetical protein
MYLPLFSYNLMPASIICYAACFLLTLYFLRGSVLLDRIMISVATMISGIWLYELIYHYMWGLSGLPTDLSRLSIALGGPVPFPIYFCLALVSLPLLGWRYIRINALFISVSVASLVLFAAWFVSGFPQFWCACSYKPIWGAWLPNQSVEPLGYIFNSLTKIVCIVPALLFRGGARLRAKRLNEERPLFVKDAIPEQTISTRS